MSENVYAVPDLTKKVRHGRGEREVEMEERGENEDRGEWEERIVDLYGTAEDFTVHDNPDPAGTQQGHGQGEREVEMEERGENEDRGEWEERIVDLYGTAEDFTVHDNPVPAGTQQDTVGMIQENTAQPQHGDPDESKKKRSRVAAVCLGIIITLCLLLLACVIGVVVHYMVLVKDRNNLAKEKKLLETSFKELEIRYTNLTEDPALLKKFLCEFHGFKFGGGLCYYISTVWKTWEESRQDCRDKQSDLMVIKSNDKQNFVVSLNQIVWLGLTEKEGNWKWVDETLLTTDYWNTDEPNNAAEREDCAEMKGDGWNDVPCSVKNRWICERVVL